jgi:hypothetical protein|tara:strand:+ start:1198 stop:1395 length:198 start_codon:yes stop_codon:yes gene_type:complete
MIANKDARLIFINFAMDSIHNQANAIYEDLIDDDIQEALSMIDGLRIILDDLTEQISHDGIPTPA